MKCFYGIVVTLILAVQTNARHVRDAPTSAEPSATDTLEKWYSHLKVTVEDFGKQFNQQVEQVKKDNPAIEENLNNFKIKIQDAFKDVNTYIPGATEQVESLQKNIQKFGEVVKKESEKIYNNFNDSTGDLQQTLTKNLKETVNHLVEDIKKTNEKITALGQGEQKAA